VEHLDQLYPRLDITLYHVLWCAQQEKFYPLVEYALYPGSVVDCRVDSHRITLHRTSVKIRGSHSTLTMRRFQGVEFPRREWYVFSDGMPAVQTETTLPLARVLELGASSFSLILFTEGVY
jgi:hypothetical protein